MLYNGATEARQRTAPPQTSEPAVASRHGAADRGAAASLPERHGGHVWKHCAEILNEIVDVSLRLRALVCGPQHAVQILNTAS